MHWRGVVGPSAIGGAGLQLVEAQVIICTFVTLTAALRSPLTARGARKQDLASMVSKLDRNRRRNRDQGRGVGMEFDLGGRERRKGSPGEDH